MLSLVHRSGSDSEIATLAIKLDGDIVRENLTTRNNSNNRNEFRKRKRSKYRGLLVQPDRHDTPNSTGEACLECNPQNLNQVLKKRQHVVNLAVQSPLVLTGYDTTPETATVGIGAESARPTCVEICSETVVGSSSYKQNCQCLGAKRRNNESQVIPPCEEKNDSNSPVLDDLAA